MTRNIPASVNARLLTIAKERGDDFSLFLNRYAVERFLYRLSLSEARDRYWLKGALLFDLWFDAPHRPTRDADLLGFGPAEAGMLAETIRAICAIEAEDGMRYDPATIAIEDIRENARYGGLRVRLQGKLGTTRCSVQLDVGYGDAVTPGPEEIVLPPLLDDQPPPRLRAYPRATVFAEKLEAIVSLGMANTRLKDYFDLLALAREGRLEEGPLGAAIAATFARRQTPLPAVTPVGLTDAFGNDPAKRAQWKAFLGRNRLEAPELHEVVRELRGFLAGPLKAARTA